MCSLSGVVNALIEVVFSGVLVGNVVVAGNRFLTSGRLGDVGRSIGVVFCFEVVLSEKRKVV